MYISGYKFKFETYNENRKVNVIYVLFFSVALSYLEFNANKIGLIDSLSDFFYKNVSLLS